MAVGSDVRWQSVFHMVTVWLTALVATHASGTSTSQHSSAFVWNSIHTRSQQVTIFCNLQFQSSQFEPHHHQSNVPLRLLSPLNLLLPQLLRPHLHPHSRCPSDSSTTHTKGPSAKAPLHTTLPTSTHRNKPHDMRNPARLIAAHLPSTSATHTTTTSSSDNSPTTSSEAGPLNLHFAPIRANTDSSTSSKTSKSSKRSSTSTATIDSLWSASLSRYTFCSSSNSRRSNSDSSTSSTHTRSRKREQKLKPRKSNTTMSSGRHGDEWLFGGWGNVFKGIWR